MVDKGNIYINDNHNSDIIKLFRKVGIVLGVSDGIVSI
jgi:hypothetical protein